MINKKYIFLSAILSSLIIITLFGFVGVVSAQTPPVELGVTCTTSNTTTIYTGDNVVWNATPSGGTGIGYTYSWSGMGVVNPQGTNTANASSGYTTAGKKTVKVTVTDSAYASKTVTCPSITVVAYPALKVTCSALPSAVSDIATPTVFTANVTGGKEGDYTYVWAGTDGITGTVATNSVTYATKGKKTAYVTVTSNGISKKSSTCSVVKSDETGDIICIKAAIDAREAAIAGAITAYTTAINTAYTNRKNALVGSETPPIIGAYQLTTIAAAKAAANVAWTAFKNAKLQATTAFKTARAATWKTYITQGNACKAPSGTGDGKYSGLEISGQ
ncbi:MAG: hypothetical protein NT094_01990 [Candidatus Staskawiczbacteria bacterium]|nr:hypothetical protein [Candidatus Staskawiczbacteria bacterium]